MDKLAKAPSLEAKTLYLIENNKLIEKALPRGKRCDMHCHDKYSDMYLDTPITKFFKVRESYTEPEEIYKTAKARGMDFVTISTHNDIRGALELVGRYEDAFVSCEYDVVGSDAGHVIHVLVSGHEYTGNPKRMHNKLLAAAKKGHEYFAKVCQEYNLFHGLAHPAWISSPKLEMKPEYLHSWLETFSHWEINGDIQLENKLARMALDIFMEDGKKKHVFAGSDCHHLNHVGLTFTETLESKIETPEEFLDVLKKGQVAIGNYNSGNFSERFHGSVKMLRDDAYTGVINYIKREKSFMRKVFFGTALIPPIGLTYGLGIAMIPYVMTFLERKTLEVRTKKLAEEYFDYLASLETMPLEQELQKLLEEKRGINERYMEAKSLIKNKSLMHIPHGWEKFVLKLLSPFEIFRTSYNFILKKEEDDSSKLPPKQELQEEITNEARESEENKK